MRKNVILTVDSMQQTTLAYLLCGLTLTAPLTAQDSPLSLDVYNAQLPKHSYWKESTLQYETKKENKDGDKAIIGGVGVRSTQLSAKGRNHPSWYPALVGLIGGEKKYNQWDWKATLEGEFQGPSFDPIRTTRYTAEVIGSRKYNEQLSAQAGAGIKFGIRSTTAYPIVGCTYIVDKWTFKLLYPMIALTSYKISEKNTVGAFIANTLTRTYRAKKACGRKDAICNFDAQFAGFLWQHYFTQKTFLTATLGWNIHADMSVGNRLNNHRKKVVDSAGGLLASLSIKTNL